MSFMKGLDSYIDGKLDKLPEPKNKKRPSPRQRGVGSRWQRAQTTIKSLDDMGDRVAGRMASRVKGKGGLEGFYDKILSRPAMVIAVVVLLTAISAIPAQAILTNMRGDLEIYLPVGHPATLTLAEVNKDWTTDTVIIYVEAAPGYNITSVDVLREMSAVEGDALNEGNSDWRLRGADWARGDDGKIDNVTAVLSISSMVKTFNESAKNFYKALNMEFPALPGMQTLPGNYSIPQQSTTDKIIALIPRADLKSMVADKDGDGIYDRAAIMLMIRRGSSPDKIVKEVDELIKSRAQASHHGHPLTTMTNTGPYTVIQKMQGRTIFELIKVLPFLIAFLMIVLFFFHRNWKVWLITLIPVCLALAMTLGLTGLANMIAPSTFIISPQLSLVIPVLLALGIAYGLYVSNRYVEETKGSPKQKMIVTVKAMNNALFLSAITEFIGFASLMVGTLPPIFTMGFSLSIGILLTYALTMLVTPPLIMIIGYEKRIEFSAWGTFASWPSSNRKKIIAIALVITAISAIFMMPLIKFDADYLAMMPADDISVVKMNEYSKIMNGGMIGMVVVRANVEKFDTLYITDLVENDMNKVKYSSCMSIVDIMKIMKTPDSVTIPVLGQPTIMIPANVSYWDLVQLQDHWLPAPHNSTREVYIRLFYNSLGDEMKFMFINHMKTRSLLFVFMPYLNVEDAEKSVGAIDAIIEEKGHPVGGSMAHLTGVGPLIIAINDLIIEGSLQTLALSIFLCWALLSVWFRSWKIGLMTIIPCVIVISYEPLTLVALNIPLSIVTVMIGSIAIGTGVDFSIQITQRMVLMGMGIKQVLSTVEHMGVSFVEATATMVLGFAAVLVAPWPAYSGGGPYGLPFTVGVGIDSIRQFIIMIMILLIFNAVMALLVLPAIYTIVIRFRESEEKRRRETAREIRPVDIEKELPAELEAEMEEVRPMREDKRPMTKAERVRKRLEEDEEIPKIY